MYIIIIQGIRYAVKFKIVDRFIGSARWPRDPNDTLAIVYDSEGIVAHTNSLGSFPPKTDGVKCLENFI